MKNNEKIIKRIEGHKQQIDWLNENVTEAMKKVSEKIAENAADPAYVAKWLDSWMTEVNYFNAQIAEYHKTIEILSWALED